MNTLGDVSGNTGGPNVLGSIGNLISSMGQGEQDERESLTAEERTILRRAKRRKELKKKLLEERRRKRAIQQQMKYRKKKRN